MNAYEEIYDELCYRVECGELSINEAELINEAAYEKYVMEANEFDPYEFDVAFEFAYDVITNIYDESVDGYLDDMEYDLFGESVSEPAYREYMSDKAYEKLIGKALKDDSLEVPEKYADDKKFVKEFKRDVKKAQKACREAQKSGVKKAVAIGAAAAAAVAAVGGGAYVGKSVYDAMGLSNDRQDIRKAAQKVSKAYKYGSPKGQERRVRELDHERYKARFDSSASTKLGRYLGKKGIFDKGEYNGKRGALAALNKRSHREIEH